MDKLYSWGHECLFLSVVCCLIAGFTMEARAADKVLMKLYFIPFEIQTYLPVTMEDIENKSSKRIWFSGDHAFCTWIQEALQSKRIDAKIDSNNIRLKVEIVDKNNFVRSIYYVDSKGKVLKDGKKTFLLSEAVMKKIAEDIRYFSGVVDINASREFLKEK